MVPKAPYMNVTIVFKQVQANLIHGRTFFVRDFTHKLLASSPQSLQELLKVFNNDLQPIGLERITIGLKFRLKYKLYRFRRSHTHMALIGMWIPLPLNETSYLTQLIFHITLPSIIFLGALRVGHKNFRPRKILDILAFQKFFFQTQKSQFWHIKNFIPKNFSIFSISKILKHNFQIQDFCKIYKL